MVALQVIKSDHAASSNSISKFNEPDPVTVRAILTAIATRGGSGKRDSARMSIDQAGTDAKVANDHPGL